MRSATAAEMYIFTYILAASRTDFASWEKSSYNPHRTRTLCHFLHVSDRNAAYKQGPEFFSKAV